MKIKNLSLLAIAVLALSGCDNAPKDTMAPEIDGVNFEATCKVGETYHLLEGISAYDETDGDITDKIQVSIIPTVTFSDGVFIPDHVGQYEISYTVSDKAGNTTTEYTGLTVEAGYSEPTIYKTISFNEYDMNGWELTHKDGVNVTTSVVQSNLKIEVSGSTSTLEDVMLTKSYKYDSEATYELNMDLTSSLAGNITVNNAPIMVSASLNELNITLDVTENEGHALVCIDLSTLGETFEVSLANIDVVISKGVAVDSDLLENYELNATDNVAVSAYDGGAIEISEISETSVTASITSQPTNRTIWSTRLYINTHVRLSPGSYTVSLDVISNVDVDDTTGSSFELMFNSGSQEKGFNGQGEFYGYKMPKDTLRTLTSNLTISENKDELVFMFQLGNVVVNEVPSTFTVSNLHIIAHDGNRIEDHDLTTFLPTGFEMSNSEDVGASGTAYTENGALIYNITSFGGVDWNNKIVIKDIALEADKFYTVVINMNASNAIKANIFLNSGEWNPILALYGHEINPETETVEATTLNQLESAGVYELLLQFGENSGVGETKVTISSIEIYSYEVIL